MKNGKNGNSKREKKGKSFNGYILKELVEKINSRMKDYELKAILIGRGVHIDTRKFYPVITALRIKRGRLCKQIMSMAPEKSEAKDKRKRK